MDYKIIFDKNTSKYGSIIELDFTEEFKNFDINVKETESHDKTESVLYQSHLREYLTPYKGSDLDLFANKHLNLDLFARVYNSIDLSAQKRITGYWPWQNFGFESIDKFVNKYFNHGVSFIKDNAGFYMGVHTDNRLVVGNAIINLTDNADSTKFYYSVQEPHNIVYEAPKERGKGVFFLNNEETAHSILVSKTRHVAMWNMSMTIIK